MERNGRHTDPDMDFLEPSLLPDPGEKKSNSLITLSGHSYNIFPPPARARLSNRVPKSLFTPKSL